MNVIRATIDGTDYFSAKKIERIVGTVIHFFDGSWINPITGDASEPKSEIKHKKSLRFCDARCVIIHDFSGVCHMHSHSLPYVLVKLEGTSEMLALILVSLVADVVHIRDAEEHSFTNTLLTDMYCCISEETHAAAYDIDIVGSAEQHKIFLSKAPPPVTIHVYMPR